LLLTTTTQRHKEEIQWIERRYQAKLHMPRVAQTLIRRTGADAKRWSANHFLPKEKGYFRHFLSRETQQLLHVAPPQGMLMSSRIHRWIFYVVRPGESDDAPLLDRLLNDCGAWR
jgi:hypothetical protein